jgi:hypothetical protein
MKTVIKSLVALIVAIGIILVGVNLFGAPGSASYNSQSSNSNDNSKPGASNNNGFELYPTRYN